MESVDAIAKEATPEPRVLKQNNIPLLHDVIVRELNRTDVSTPLPSGNIDVLLRGDFDLLLSAREEVRRSLQTTTAARSKRRGRSKSVSPRSVNSCLRCADNSAANQVTR